jgi:hypothetical protein
MLPIAIVSPAVMIDATAIMVMLSIVIPFVVRVHDSSRNICKAKIRLSIARCFVLDLMRGS